MARPGRRPRIAVLERRLQNPFGEPSAPVRLTRPGMTPRWFNSASRPDQFWRAKELGWEGVTPEMVCDLTQVGHHTVSPDGYVTRGPRGDEVLMCMLTKDYRAIQAAKTEENQRRLRPHQQRTEAIEALGQTDPQTAEFLHDAVEAGYGGPTGTVRDSYERIERTIDPSLNPDEVS